ncbi:MAG: hypothetical protein NC307_14520 [Roseburia sp.]|nr:hypothetical protein [Roseburia sp.]
MKKKITAILIGCIMLSVALNVYFLWRISSANKQISVFSSQVVMVDDEIEELNNQLSGLGELENKVKDLQEQLAQRDEEISRLTASLTGNEMEIARLENEVAEGKTAIESLEEQQQQPEQQEIAEQPAQQQPQQPQQPVNPMPTYPGEFERNDSGIGTVEPGTLGVGTFE